MAVKMNARNDKDKTVWIVDNGRVLEARIETEDDVSAVAILVGDPDDKPQRFARSQVYGSLADAILSALAPMVLARLKKNDEGGNHGGHRK